MLLHVEYSICTASKNINRLYLLLFKLGKCYFSIGYLELDFIIAEDGFSPLQKYNQNYYFKLLANICISIYETLPSR